MMIGPIRHKLCGRPVTVAVLTQDVAIYVFCETCHDLIEAGELDVPNNNDDEGREINSRRFVVYEVGANQEPIAYERDRTGELFERS
jgi:hypothetical protein